MSERPWYKRYPSNFLAGTSELTVEEKGAYSVIIDLIYDRRRPVPNDSQWLGRVAGCSTRAWNSLRDKLIAKGKISITDDGCITCARATDRMEHEAAEAAAVRENGAKGGRKAAENRGKIAPEHAENWGNAGNNNDLSENVLVAVPETRDQNSNLSLRERVPAPAPAPAPAHGARGTRLSADWRPTAEGAALATNLDLDPDAVLATFRDYWLAQAGQKGRKADWEATWRNWCRREGEHCGQSGSPRLPLLRQIDGGRGAPSAADPNDAWGIEAWCISIGAVPLTDPGALAKGKWGHGGKIIDWTARQVAEAAGFSRAWRGNWSPLLEWLNDGCSTREHILPSIKQFAAWCASNGRPAASLAVFDRAVRERRAA